MSTVEPNFKAKKSRTRAGYGTGSKGKATVLHSKIVRARADGRCERCGRSDRALECAHIVGRRFAATRTDEHNAWALCHGCHSYLTENPFEHVLLAIRTLGDDGYRALLAKAYAGSKMKWDVELARLQALSVELEL